MYWITSVEVLKDFLTLRKAVENVPEIETTFDEQGITSFLQTNTGKMQ
jgi:hypothetical protein